MEKQIVLKHNEHEHLLVSGRDRVNDKSMWYLLYPSALVQTWLDGLAPQPSLTGHINRCELQFHSAEHAALFKMFWL